MPNTYVALRTTTVGTATPSVTLDVSGISGYTDLVLVAMAKNPTGDSDLCIRFNSDTATNYSSTFIYGTGSSAASVRNSSINRMRIGRTDNTSAYPNIIQIQNYSNATTYKTAISRSQNGSLVLANVGLWRSTAAITSITIIDENGYNFAVGSTFSLYGIANADQGSAKATGGIIAEDSQYWYHTFGASGAFIPKQSLTCDVLVVAGGGGGGGYTGGGGGSGGVTYFASQSLAGSTTYNCTVGAGGTASSGSTAPTNGVNSQFASLTAAVGGGRGALGGGANNWAAASGGSGGGGGSSSNTSGAASTQSGTGTTAFYGNAGGNSPGASGNYVSGGGGGAGGAGATPASSTANAGTGGIGTAVYSSWGLATGMGENVSGTVYFAGGGGGSVGTGSSLVGAGGFGGGGRGGYNGSPIVVPGAGAVNTGGGGGGGNLLDNSTGVTGGSGVIIVRYLKA